ncbi:hypothetical protein [Lederbergia graminis]|uniref:Uncharacterized protein n=1 Tax=Lederbergia graminis TaxID=735518 RepID=A0ABW0LKR3_9BACI
MENNTSMNKVKDGILEARQITHNRGFVAKEILLLGVISFITILILNSKEITMIDPTLVIPVTIILMVLMRYQSFYKMYSIIMSIIWGLVWLVLGFILTLSLHFVLSVLFAIFMFILGFRISMKKHMHIN